MYEREFAVKYDSQKLRFLDDRNGCTIKVKYRFWVLFTELAEMHAYRFGGRKFETTFGSRRRP